MSLIYPLVLFQVCSCPPKADPASHPPSPLVSLCLDHGTHVVHLQREQPPDFDVLVDDAVKSLVDMASGQHWAWAYNPRVSEYTKSRPGDPTKRQMRSLPFHQFGLSVEPVC